MRFKEIIGNDDIKDYLEKSISQKNILHSYLFLGTSGIGKLEIAREFARKILCLENTKEECTCKSCTCFNGKNHPDYYLINEEGENIKIDIVRSLTDKVIEKPIVSNRKVYIINDFEKMTKEAQNCLLKTLEEPPEFVTIILVSSNENLILNTIKSRCMALKFKNIKDDELLNYCVNNLGYENVSSNLLKSFGGSIGKAINLKDNKEKYDEIDGIISNIKSLDLISLMTKGKILYDKENIDDILNYVIVCLFSRYEEDEKYIDCIKYVQKAEERLRANSNFDMSLDNMLIEIWEELNESSNRR